MTWQTKLFVWSIAALQSMLARYFGITAIAPVKTLQVDLFSAGPAMNGNQIASDYTVCDFSGYAQASGAATHPVSSSGINQSAYLNAFFASAAGSPYVADTAIGYIVTDTLGDFVGGEFFDTPVPFAAPGVFQDLSILMAVPVFSSP
jgi:hypothetical protein